MKLKLITFIILLSGALFLHGQGTFLWDQQATNIADGGTPINNQPLGQTFTPTQSSMDVVAFYLSNGSSSASDVEVTLLTGSITGTILGTSMPATIPGDAVGMYDFFFASPISLTPGTQYYLQVTGDAGNDVFANLVNAPIPTGGAIYAGALHNNFNFWYQEGIVVPEPSLTALFVVGGCILFCRRNRRLT